MEGEVQYLPGTAEDLIWQQYLEERYLSFIRVLPEEVHGAFRRKICKQDPLLFALIYLRHHLSSPETKDEVSFSDFHLDLLRWANEHLTKNAADRRAWVAARGSGKSTWLFLILPLWALVHYHRKFIIAFADSGGQAEQHLISFKREIDTNALLRKDHSGFVRPARRGGDLGGATVSDTRNLWISHTGVAFQAKGIDSSTLGSKVGNQRPDWVIFDDVEPDEANYRGGKNDPFLQKRKRLSTMRDAVLPMNSEAVVSLVGTVNMWGSIVHDVVRYETEPKAELEPWVAEDNFIPKYYPMLFTGPDGEKRSAWEQRYPLAWCLEREHTAYFKKSYQNDPRGKDGGYWSDDDFTYGTLGLEATRWGLFIDPAVTTKGTSDYTGLAVVAASPNQDRVEVVKAWHVKLLGEPLRKHILGVLRDYPRIKMARVEVNQGGDLWKSVLHSLPVKLQVFTQDVGKEIRFAEALDYYQRRQPVPKVLHRERFSDAEGEMIGFPDAAHDDIADAVCQGVLYFLGADHRVKVEAYSERYA